MSDQKNGVPDGKLGDATQKQIDALKQRVDDLEAEQREAGESSETPDGTGGKSYRDVKCDGVMSFIPSKRLGDDLTLKGE